MPSTESLMEMFATLILFALIAMLLLTVFGKTVGGGEVPMGQAYPVTQKIVFRINTMSASLQNETAILKIDPFQYNITFDVNNNYVESKVKYFGDTKYGLFLFPDISLIAPDYIDCPHGECLPKNLVIEKKVYEDGPVEITVWEEII